ASLPVPFSTTFNIGGVSFHPAPTGVRVLYAEGYAAFFIPAPDPQLSVITRSTTESHSTGSTTVRSRKSRARSPAVVGRGHDSLDCDCLRRRTIMEHPKSPIRRCAIYTRKSSEEGLEQDFNSLHAQREACEAFIKSQAGEGWRLVKTAYDDGGLSGGTMERPALQRLLSDINQGLIDVVVVYKVDRLTRSLADFAKMVEVFDAHGVSFVAVTQQFNTTTSMGRLTLNVLLSFA